MLTGDGDFNAQPSKKRKREHTRKSGNVPSSLDQLRWTNVPFPEHFEDAEGFFGLEEVSDVEVTRNEQSGQVGYKLVSKKGIQSNGSKSKPQEKPSNEKQSNGNGVKSDDEWSGFNDSSTEEQVPPKQKFKQHKVAQSEQPSTSSQFNLLDEIDNNHSDVRAWHDLNLSEQTLSALSRLRFTKPTPIQRAAIPDIMGGLDVVGKASTGSGKTLAFGIPMYEHLLRTREQPQDRHDKGMTVDHYATSLIISPTRELAHQLAKHLNDLCSADEVSIITLTGGLSVHKQKRLLMNGDIIIGTPGRIWELMSEGDDLRKKLSELRFLVLDEADRLLSEGNFKELEEIINALDATNDADDTTQSRKDRQTLVFSATFQKNLQRKLTSKSKTPSTDLMSKQESMEYLLKKLNFQSAKPKFIDVSPTNQMAANLSESILECAALEKDLYLYALLLHHPKTRTLVFVNSISAVRRLVPLLQNLNLQALALHSQMPQKARLRSIERFSSPSSPSSILIATDVAARGLDIPSVQLILHYHVPRAADGYVHRSGRTARAEKSGSSILLCAPEEVQGVRRLIAKIHVQSKACDTKKHFIKTIDLDGRVVDRLKHRVSLAKKVTDASLAKEKHGQEDNWLRTAAEELGVEYDSEDFAAMEGTQKGRGGGRRKKEREARDMGKGEVAGLRAELREELRRRFNVGVSERYLTAGGGVDVDGLLEGRDHGSFLEMAGVIS